MSNSKPRADAKARFEKDIASHEMTVRLAQGMHRHLTFRRPSGSVYHFHITTWPGYLCISGDMGCYVFSRLPDMFEFFRESSINPQYWAQKLQADEKYTGHRAFSEDLYHAALKSDFEGWTFDSEDDRKRAWEAIEDEFDGIMHAESTEHAVRQAMEWKCPVSKQRFSDFWEHTLEDYTFQFLWCCYAIQWAIARFDETTAASTEQPSAIDAQRAEAPPVSA